MPGSQLAVYTQNSNSHPLYNLLDDLILCVCMCTYMCVALLGTAGLPPTKPHVPQDQESSLIPFLCSPTQDVLCKTLSPNPLALLKVSHEQACPVQPHSPSTRSLNKNTNQEKFNV